MPLAVDTERIIMEYLGQLYVKKLDNLNEISTFFKRLKILKPV